MTFRHLIALLIAAALLAACVAGIGSAQGLKASGSTTVPTTRCLKVPAALTNVLRSSLAFSAGGQLFYTRAVKSPKTPALYFVSAQIRSTQLGRKRPIATWAVDKLAAAAVASPLNATARAYSDLATPDAGAINVTMRSTGALASQKCVTKLIR
jgi:hypothetical protein